MIAIISLNFAALVIMRRQRRPRVGRSPIDPSWIGEKSPRDSAQKLGLDQAETREPIIGRVAVLTVSCDLYADLWNPHFTLLQRFWPDCPFPRYLGTNTKDFIAEGVTVIKVGPDISWSDNLLIMLDRIPEEYVLILLDDFFMWTQIESRHVIDMARHLIDLQGGCLRLIPRPGPDRIVDRHFGIGEISATAPYRVSTQGALWKKDHLRMVVKPGESIWQFEMCGSKRNECRKLSYYACTWPVLTYEHHVVQRGKWFPWYRKRLKKLSINYDEHLRPSLTTKEILAWSIRKSIALWK